MGNEESRALQKRYPTVSVVIPAYNERRRMGPTLDRLAEFSQRNDWALEVVVVDDGSRDETAEVVRTTQWEPLNVLLLVNERNEGKGYSVSRGMLAASGDVLVMSDADLSVSMDHLFELLPWMDRGFDVVIGSRYMPDSQIVPPRPLGRRWMAFVFRVLCRRILFPDVRDTQCGFKCFRPAVARELFQRQTIASWTFDCEVLGMARRLGYRIKEVGVFWNDDHESRVSPWRDAPRALRDLFWIWRRLRKVPRD